MRFLTHVKILVFLLHTQYIANKINENEQVAGFIAGATAAAAFFTAIFAKKNKKNILAV